MPKTLTPTQKTRTQVGTDWLAVSTDGFAAMNRGRPPAHLVKELVQNSLDALNGDAGRIDVTLRPHDGSTRVSCEDTGPGLGADMSLIRTVFHTSKTDSPTARGRMGRGFKEMLCLAELACVYSGHESLQFVIEDGQRKIYRCHEHRPVDGTEVVMHMPWNPAETLDTVVAYLHRLLVPPQIQLFVNDIQVTHRQPAYHCTGKLVTEQYDTNTSAWRKPKRTTEAQLVHVHPGEEPFLYEMGIPVCDAGWTLPYHIDVQQRIPMNPKRDAVMTHYEQAAHALCLPSLADDLPDDALKHEWVGTAASHCDTDTQQLVVGKVFGTNAVRSVPDMGRRSADAEAIEQGREIVRTRHQPEGFRQLCRDHLPTSAAAVAAQRAEEIASTTFSLIDIGDPITGEKTKRAKRIRKHAVNTYGADTIAAVQDFTSWYCECLLAPDAPAKLKVTTWLSTGGSYHATWQNYGEAAAALTLNLATAYIWEAPIAGRLLELLHHEAAHWYAEHHGENFDAAQKRLGGRGAALLFCQHDAIADRFGRLFESD
jgi:hypothetical protein